MNSELRPNIEDEIEELDRVSQDLSKDEGIEISTKELIDAFNKSKEQVLTDKIWGILENTESNEIAKGDFDSVKKIQKKYGKTNFQILAKAIKSGVYERPLILNFNGRYHLVAGNTRLCTAKAMGINPKVFIAKIDTEQIKNEEIMKENEVLKGGLADNMTVKTIAKKHNVKIDVIVKQFHMGIKTEMEHTDNKKMAMEIAKDHLMEDPFYYTKLKKIEAMEATDASSAGGYEGPMSVTLKKKDIEKIKNWSSMNESTEASSSGGFDVPLFGGTKGRKNPLKIEGPESIKKSKAVKDKNFPKWGGPGGVFIKIKEKCKKYPYCNQGDINAIEMLEQADFEKAIAETSKKTGIPYNEVEKIVINEINKIFIK